MIFRQNQSFADFLEPLEKRLIVDKQKQLLAKMKKPALYAPNKKPSDSGEIINAKLEADGTILTYLNGEKYPVRAYPDLETVWFTAYYKNFVPLIANSLAKQGWIQRIITVLALKYNYEVFIQWFERMSKMGNFLLKDEHWSRPVKEIRRVLKDKIDINILDAGTLVLEYDSAYRFMMQDILPLLDKTAFNKNPIKELQRLFDIFISRNTGGEQKMKNMWKFLKLYLTINRKLLKQVKEIVNELNLEEIKPTDEDRYWMLYLRAYNCFGLTAEQAMAEYSKIKNS